ncbi:MAG TPA: right-handed parallel beta-helix repeat-containing protein, partial [Anaerolineae bacterium]|nr:right-handed parallel beta-helix repeat-containing protein [Anaerolineae bacterium]
MFAFLFALLLLIASVGISASHAEPLEPVAPCSVTGLIGGNVTWSSAVCDPYILTGSIIVQPGATLTIQAGTQVRFTSLKALMVNGTLVARGTSGNRITFTSDAAEPAKGDWGYIYFTNSSTDAVVDANGNYVSGSILEYAVIEYAGGASISPNGVVRVDASSPYLHANAIHHNKADGIHVWNDGAPFILDNEVTDNGIPASANANGIYVDSSGTLVVRGNTVSDNTYHGIYVDNQPTAATGETSIDTDLAITDTVSLAGSTIHDNTVTGNGQSGISLNNYGSAATINGNTVVDNGYDGIYVSSGSVSLDNNIVYDNGQDGIDVNSSTFTIANSQVDGNGSRGIYAYGTGTISGNTITSNTGGGIYCRGSYSTVDITGNSISNNSTSYNGGGIYVTSYGMTANITGNSITGNQTSQTGGGICLDYVYATANINGNTIIGNSANSGGGIYFSGGGSITNNRILDNQAAQNNGGAGIYLTSQPPIHNNDIYGNLAGVPSVGNDVTNGNPVNNDVDATDNYWGTTDSNTIEEHVWHFIDDSSLSIVNYVPFFDWSALVQPSPACKPGYVEVLSFGPEDLNAPSDPNITYTFTVPPNHGPAGEILVWQGEGHYWDYNCNQGPNNDNGRYPCDQGQPGEVIAFSVNGVYVNRFVDHSPDDDRNFYYEWPLSNLQVDVNTLYLDNEPWSDSVFYRGTVCAQLPALAVSLASFEAVAQADDVLLRWETVSEVDNTGFNLYRATRVDGEQTLLAFIPSQAPGSSQGFAYEWLDSDVTAGETYH